MEPPACGLRQTDIVHAHMHVDSHIIMYRNCIGKTMGYTATQICSWLPIKTDLHTLEYLWITSHPRHFVIRDFMYMPSTIMQSILQLPMPCIIVYIIIQAVKNHRNDCAIEYHTVQVSVVNYTTVKRGGGYK